MTQEKKQLLLIDLCARLPYGVKVSIVAHDLDYEKDFGKTIIAELTSVHTVKDDDGTTHTCFITCYDKFKTQGNDIDTIKPYLRPMSSMTEEEKIELCTISYAPDEMKTIEEKLYVIKTNAENAVDFYNRHHFDYRGLIEKSLAIVAPENMYK